MPTSRRLLPFANAFISSVRASPRENGSGRLLLPNENRWPPEPSSYGSATAASLSGSITGLCDASNATPLLHACATSRTAAGMWQLPKSAVPVRSPAERAAALAGVLLVEERRHHEARMRAKELGTGPCHISRVPSSSIEVPPPTHPNLLPGGGCTGCSVRGPRVCRGAPSTRGCDVGRAVCCELSCGQATPLRGSVTEPF